MHCKNDILYSGTKKNRQRIGYPILLSLAFLLLFIITGCGSPTEVTHSASTTAVSSRSATDTLTVHFLDVGQGNAVLVQCGGESMLIDGGDRETSSFVVSYLKKQKIDSLDYIIASHYDADHLNGIVGALHVFDIGTVLEPSYTSDTNIYQSYRKALKEIENTPVHPKAGDTYQLGEATFTIVCPQNYEYSSDNNKSIGIKLSLGSNSFLILGDAEEQSEADMLASGIDVSATVYLASHHGSATSSSEEFLAAVNPAYAIVSVGHNSYGHPSMDTLNRLKKQGVKLFRTDEQGTIIADCDSSSITFRTEPTDDWSEGVEAKKAGKTPQSESTEPGLIGNAKTKKFHLPSCSGLPDKKNQILFETREEALLDDYSPCKRCNP